MELVNNLNVATLAPLVFKFARKIETLNVITDKTGVAVVDISPCHIPGLLPMSDIENALNFGPRKTPKEYVKAELDWYLNGSCNVWDDKAPIAEKAKIWADVADNNGNVNSNYGHLILDPETHDQFIHVMYELLKNPVSRRAAMIYNRPSIWDEYDKDGMSDFICTYATQHRIYDNFNLHTTVFMRSNDFIFGFFNDFFWQSWVHNKLRKALIDLQPKEKPLIHPSALEHSGLMDWMTGSMHVYERHFDLILRMRDWAVDNGIGE